MKTPPLFAALSHSVTNVLFLWNPFALWPMKILPPHITVFVHCDFWCGDASIPASVRLPTSTLSLLFSYIYLNRMVERFEIRNIPYLPESISDVKYFRIGDKCLVSIKLPTWMKLIGILICRVVAFISLMQYWLHISHSCAPFVGSIVFSIYESFWSIYIKHLYKFNFAIVRSYYIKIKFY